MSAPTKRFLLTALVPILVVIIVVALMANREEKPVSPSLPVFDAAELYGYDAAGKVVTRPLGVADLGRLRPELEAAVFDREPMKWVFLGELKLLQDGREVLQVDLFRGSSDDFLPIRIGKLYYRLRPPGVIRELLKSNDLIAH